MMLSKTGLPLAIAMATPTAHAADWYTGVPAVVVVAPAPIATLDASIDGASQGSLTGALIGKIAPFDSLAESGPRLRASVVAGTYAYDATDLIAYVPVGGQFIPTTSGYGRVRGTLADGSFMAGYEQVTQNAALAAYLGVGVASNSLSVYDPGNPVRGARVGVKIGFEAFFLPSETTMVSAIAYYSTSYNSYYSRLKFGLALAPFVYAGPEMLALGDDYFSQWRLGAHVSGLRFGVLQMGVSGGYLQDRVRGSGAYGILDTRLAF